MTQIRTQNRKLFLPENISFVLDFLVFLTVSLEDINCSFYSGLSGAPK